MSSSSHQKHLIAVCQLNCKDSKEDNFKVCEKLIREAANYKCSMVFLPEFFDVIHDSRKAILSNLETFEGSIVQNYRKLASECKIWMSLGGLREKIPNNDEKSCISHMIIDDKGQIVATYRKVHLFNAEISGVLRLMESEFTDPGNRIVPPVSTPIGKIGLGICYDLRFPEFAISMAKAGADILAYPSSFTVATGSDHWEVMLKARAIDNQCYVIGAGQVGVHNSKLSTWGHSMVIDPWGAVIAQCGDGVGLALALIDPEHLQKIRNRLPLWTGRRPDVYGEVVAAENVADIDSTDLYQFGQVKVTSNQVFLRTRFSFALVNIRPFLPGHCLVAPLRPTAKRIVDLNQVEISDFFYTVQRVQKALETEYNTSSSLVAAQDGPDAGRTIEHLHVHIIPRKKGDTDLDVIHADLAKHDKADGEKRSEEEMKEESYRMRRYFYTNNS